MTREERREKVNDQLKARVVGGMTKDDAKPITDGLSSGSMQLNMALSGNPFVGYAWGRIVEIYGPERGGKTTIALHAIKEAQHLEDETGQEVPVLFIDAEHALDASYAMKIGIDLERLDISQPDYGEQALALAETALDNEYKVIVVDSVAALVPRAEIEGDMGDSHVGLQARLMSQAMRKLTGKVSKAGAIIIFINQIRMKIGVMFGNPETTPGGNALKFYASYRLEVRSPRSGKQTGKTLMGYGKEDSAETGTKTKVKVVKNKLYPPFRVAEFVIEYGVGIDRVQDIIDFLVWADAFTDGDKENSVYIPCKDKHYTKVGLKKVIHEMDVQADLIQIIRGLEVKKMMLGDD
jgi:recombination protein RecA